MENKKKGGFAGFLIAYICIFVLAAVVAVRYFYPVFAEYENNLPKTIAAEYMRSFDENKIRELTAGFVASLDSEIETPEESFQELNKIFKDGVTCRRVSSEARDNSCVYTLIASGKKIGSLVLETQDEKRGGFAEWIHPRHWYVAEEKTEDFSGLIRSDSVTVPEGITVMFGGKQLGEADMSGEKIEVSSLKKLYAGYPDLPHLVCYSVTGYLAEHEFICVDGSGCTFDCSGGIEAAERYITDNCSDEEKKSIDAFCDDFIHRFTQFNSNAGNGFYSNLDSLRELLVPGTTYYDNLALARESLSYTRPHNNSVDGITMNSYTRLDKNTLLVGFSYLYSEQGGDGNRKQATCDVTLYIRETPEGYLVESCLTGPAVAVE